MQSHTFLDGYTDYSQHFTRPSLPIIHNICIGNKICTHHVNKMQNKSHIGHWFVWVIKWWLHSYNIDNKNINYLSNQTPQNLNWHNCMLDKLIYKAEAIISFRGAVIRSVINFEIKVGSLKFKWSHQQTRAQGGESRRCQTKMHIKGGRDDPIANMANK